MVNDIKAEAQGAYVVVTFDGNKYELTAGQAQQLAAALSMTAFKVTSS